MHAMIFPLGRAGVSARRGAGHAPAAALAWCIVLLAGGTAGGQMAPGAVPLDLDRPVGWLGISIQEVGEELADRLAARFGPAAGTGVLVVDAVAGGPAAAAGLRGGDVIVGVDSQPIWDVRQLQRRVRAMPVGAQARITVLRDAERHEIPVVVGPMPEEALAALLGETLGFGIRPALARPGRPGRVEGSTAPAQPHLVVSAVDARSPARAAGMRPMDVVLEVDGRAVHTLKDLYAALRGASGKPAFTLTVSRDGAPLVLTLVPGTRPPAR